MWLRNIVVLGILFFFGFIKLLLLILLKIILLRFVVVGIVGGRFVGVFVRLINLVLFFVVKVIIIGDGVLELVKFGCVFWWII